MLGKDYEGQDCGLARALEVVGERWTLLILRDAFYGVRRFNDFAVHLDTPRAVLASRLQRLVGAELLAKDGDSYVLTKAGQELWPAVYALMRWGVRFQDGRRLRRFLHAECKAILDEVGRCPRCGVTPPPGDVLTAGAGARPRRDDVVSAALHAPRRLLEPLTL